MNECRNEPERIVVQWVTGSTATIPNRQGTSCLALGSLDTAGAVIVTPQQSQSTSIKPFIVSARAPFVGWLEGPLNITPVGGVEPLSSAQYAQLDVMDIMSFPHEPNSKPARAAYFYDGAPVGSTFYFRVRGRKRIIVTVQTTGTAIISIEAQRLVDGSLFTIDSKSTAAGTSLTWQPNPLIQGDGTTDPSFDVIDYMNVQTGGTFSHVGVEAWDD